MVFDIKGAKSIERETATVSFDYILEFANTKTSIYTNLNHIPTAERVNKDLEDRRGTNRW